MPNTLPGFLVVAGVIMYVLSLFTGKFTAQDIEGEIKPSNRNKLRKMGVTFMFLGGVFYGLHMAWPNIVSLPTLFMNPMPQ
jgi:hypothetical protein